MAKKAKTKTRGAPAARTAAKISNGHIFFRAILVILIVLIAAGAIWAGGFLWKHTNGFATGFKRMYVEVNGTRYITSAEVRLPYSGNQRFNVGYISGGKGFTYAIYANEDAAFEYTVDGLGYQFRGDYTNAFEIEADDKGLTIKGQNDNVQTVFRRRYGANSQMTLPELDKNKVYFNLLVTSSDEEQTVIIGLLLSEIQMGITPGEIIF